ARSWFHNFAASADDALVLPLLSLRSELFDCALSDIASREILSATAWPPWEISASVRSSPHCVSPNVCFEISFEVILGFLWLLLNKPSTAFTSTSAVAGFFTSGTSLQSPASRSKPL